jgi:Electron transfer DM13
MTSNAITWISRHKLLLIAASIPVLVALWWAFRPEKLWINQTVNEAAPFDTSGDPDPTFTGQFDGNAGRITVFKKPDGQEFLRVKDLTIAGDADAHVELAKSSEVTQAQGAAKADVGAIDLGSLKASQGDQNYDLPAATDLAKYDTVVIYNKRTSAILGSAKLEAF